MLASMLAHLGLYNSTKRLLQKDMDKMSKRACKECGRIEGVVKFRPDGKHGGKCNTCRGEKKSIERAAKVAEAKNKLPTVLDDAIAPNIVTLDIETAPLESYHWGLWDQNISLDMMHIDWSVLSFSAKWLDESEVKFESTGGRGKHKVRDDKELLKKLWLVLDRADIVVGQNVRDFDIKKINARMLQHNMKPYSMVRVVDTMHAAKQVAAFPSNKLAYLSKVLTENKKSEHKRFPGFELWKECLADNPAAWGEMEAYNKMDVISTEELYLRLRPWMRNHPNLAIYALDESPRCPRCGSSELTKNGTNMSQASEYQRFRCGNCGGWAQGKEMLTSLAKRRSMLR